MHTVVVAPSNVASFPEGGGHFWVYMQYVQGLRSLGIDVYWLERFRPSGDSRRDSMALELFEGRMASFGMSGKMLLYTEQRAGQGGLAQVREFRCDPGKAEAVFDEADLLMNFHYGMAPDLLRRFRRTALVDIDPGLLQFWISQGQIDVAPHDVYFSTGETVGTEQARFPDCGLDWQRIRPPVCLDSWPYFYRPQSKAFTTVSGWWGGDGKGEFIVDGRGAIYENNKRVTFLQYLGLPELTDQVLELALNLGEGDAPEASGSLGRESWPHAGGGSVTDYVSDAADRKLLESRGWRVRHAYEVAASPDAYRNYVQASRGEFSCVKPSCIRFQNAWVSDRTLCYLASGKPVITQHTGPSRILPNGEGMFRFETLEEAAQALRVVDSDYERHCRAARRLAESCFDARTILTRLLATAV